MKWIHPSTAACVLSSVPWSVSLKKMKNRSERGGADRPALRVCSCLNVWTCAVCVCGSLRVCFCQWQRVFSMSYTRDGLGADVLWSYRCVHPGVKKKRKLSGQCPTFIKKCKISDHVIIKTYHKQTTDWITPKRLPKWENVAVTELTVTFKRKIPPIASTHKQTWVKTDSTTLKNRC